MRFILGVVVCALAAMGASLIIDWVGVEVALAGFLGWYFGSKVVS